MPVRVLIVAPYAAVRAGLHALLGEAEDLLLLGAVSGSEEMERVLPALEPDVVVYDDNAGEAARILAMLEDTDSGLVMLSDDDSGYRRLATSPLRGWAYLRKEAEGQEISGAARAVAAGLLVLDRSLSGLLTAAPPAAPAQRSTVDRPAEEALTHREQQVLQLVALGLPNKQIAARLSISLSTVKFHVASLLAKLGASSRTEAVTTGASQGLVSL